MKHYYDNRPPAIVPGNGRGKSVCTLSRYYGLPNRQEAFSNSPTQLQGTLQNKVEEWLNHLVRKLGIEEVLKEQNRRKEL